MIVGLVSNKKVWKIFSAHTIKFYQITALLFACNIQVLWSQCANSACFTCTSNGIACISSAQYVTCTASSRTWDFSWVRSCPSAAPVCNSTSAFLAGLPCFPADGAIITTCSGSDAASAKIVTSAGTNAVTPAIFCAKTNEVGLFKHPTLTCTSYIRCFFDSSGTTITGVSLTCPGKTTFNPTTKICDTSTNC